MKQWAGSVYFFGRDPEECMRNGDVIRDGGNERLVVVGRPIWELINQRGGGEQVADSIRTDTGLQDTTTGCVSGKPRILLQLIPLVKLEQWVAGTTYLKY